MAYFRCKSFQSNILAPSQKARWGWFSGNLTKLKAEARGLEWIEATVQLSVLTLVEIGKGLAAAEQTAYTFWRLGWNWNCKPAFLGRILPSLRESLTGGGCSPLKPGAGRTLSAIDGLLAATALHHNLTIVSGNLSDFAGTQVPILNPWERDLQLKLRPLVGPPPRESASKPAPRVVPLCWSGP